MACLVCRHLRVLFTERQVSVDLGPLEELLKTPCPGHDALLLFLRDDFASAKPGKVLLERHGGPTAEILVNDEPDISSSNQVWPLLLARRRHEAQIPGHGRRLDPDWISLGLIREWKEACAGQHREQCCNPFKIGRVSPAWLIDTVRDCLVPGTAVSEYVSLSYRWGASTGFRTVGRLLDDVQKPGSLSTRGVAAGIAPSIRHAMQLVRAIDERYLWADAVCIVQDDEAHVASQLQLMGAIYASAKLTIVATDGDAMDGIRGLEGISPSRELCQTVIPLFLDDKVIVRNTPVLANLSGSSPYFARGWTFQEFYLAQRRLIFAESQVFWDCSCALWSEDLIQAQDEGCFRGSRQRDSIANILAGQPDFGELGRLLAEYNHSHLTYPEDAVPGVTGLLAILSPSFPGGFLLGLPEVCFDSALMWRTGLFWNLERRLHSGRRHSILPDSHLPSWSWVSWQSFGMRISDEETFNVSSPRGCRTTPITQWYSHGTPDSSEGRPIRSTWFEIYDKINDPAFVTPPGWTREEYSPAKHDPADGKHHIPEGLGKYVYKHSAIADCYSWFPVPIATVDEDVGPSPQMPYISCDTKRAWFAASRIPASESSFDQQLKIEVHLADEHGRHCGKLHLHTSDDVSHFPDAASPNGGLRVELVAICLQRSLRHGAGPEDYQDLYGVLWVEWIHGVAYRRASGFVEKQSWEEHDLEDIHLILG